MKPRYFARKGEGSNAGPHDWDVCQRIGAHVHCVCEIATEGRQRTAARLIAKLLNDADVEVSQW